MSKELKLLKENISSFLETINNAYFEYIDCDIDDAPQFDKKSLIFDFVYCNSISMVTSQGNFTVQTATDSEGLDTFWIVSMKDKVKSDLRIEIKSNLLKSDFTESKYKIPFKLRFKFNNTVVLLYAAEIYDTSTTLCDYKINDEMILLFRNEEDATTFEALLDRG
jgi:hypothetical protein